jgi:uncharacterized peroxidase-related enzyme
MAHINLPEGLPGIRGPMVFSPETTAPLRDLAQILLHDANSLTPGERELIATYVSSQNDCYYCQTCHGSTAAHHLDGNMQLIDDVKHDFESAAISDKLKALLHIAGRVQQGGKSVTEGDVAQARGLGATDKEIHDTVLIAAAFCMFNRYVDGLATFAPRNAEFYREVGERTSRYGYLKSGWEKPVQLADSTPQAIAS